MRYKQSFLFILLCSLVPFFLCVENARSSAIFQGPISIRWTADPTSPGKVAVEVAGLSEETLRRLKQGNWDLSRWRRLFSVYTGKAHSANAANLLPMLGAYHVQSTGIRFEPQFPLESGASYHAVFRPDQLPGITAPGIAPITSEFDTPRGNLTPSTEVRQVYPSGDSAPENLLKFYIHFTGPMRRGNIYDHIHLRNETGKNIELPFLEIDEELWDPSLTRLTLFFDPGRIKRGVRPLEEIGPSLEAGKSYTLVIDRDWLDAAGNPLTEGFQKVFKVMPPDRQPVDPAQWKIEAPRPGSRAPLAVIFSKPMDQALAQRLLSVADETGEAVKGSVLLTDHERQWAFTPESVWRPGHYQLIIPTTLEDLAGNNIGKPFEVDLFEGVERRISTTTVKLPFEIR